MGILIGGERAWRVRRAGPLVVSYQWVNGEPTMLLFPSRPREGAGAYVIPLGSAWAFADSTTGAPTPYLLKATFRAAEVMLVDYDRSMLRHIADAIVDGLPDLVVMPPEPDWHLPEGPKTEVVLKIDGQTVAETEVA